MSNKGKIAALIVAGGQGQRCSSTLPKQYMELGGRPLMAYSIEAFLSHPDVDFVRVVIHPDNKDLYEKAVVGFDILAPVFGGEVRQKSVCLGLKSFEELDPDLVLIHDAARPLISHDLISRVIDATEKGSAIIPTLKVSDTLKKVEGENVISTVDRENLVSVSTPQGFYFKEILEAHQEKEGESFSDDAGIFEALGKKVKTVNGDKNNLKVTEQEDFLRAENIIQGRYMERVGTGLDVHKFSEDESRELIICGIKIPHDKGLVGHSDADVGLHAIIDAVLGAIGEGDIGEHFSPSDDRWKDADSEIFVEHVVHLLERNKAEINNLDVTIICEQPKLSSYKEEMKENVAKIFKIGRSQVNIKATTTEKLGFLGRGEGIAAQAIASVKIR